MARSREEKKTEKTTEEKEEIVSFDTDDMVREEEPPKESPEVTALREELAKAKDDYLRLRADHENFRRRNQEAVGKARQDAVSDTVETMLPVADSIDRALKICTDEKLTEGLLLIKRQFETALSQLGITEIEADGVPFDHNFHNAVMKAETEGEDVGKVLEVFQRGYKLGNKVIRYAMVKVGVEKSEE